jgi:endonuclease/exonuclease/phosphatase (EEP) superfamily protein YafD
VAAVVLAGAVAPRALGGPSEPEGGAGPHLRVLTANMRLGSGSAPALVALVRSTRADVLSVQELTPELVTALDKAGLGAVMPHYVLAARGGAQGTGVYARVPLRETGRPIGTLSAMVTATADVEGFGPVELLAVHTPPPTRGRITVWDDDLRALPRAGDSLRIMAGDFNATLDHAELRRVLDDGYEDAAAVVGAGLQGTWPSGRRVPPPVAIDHVLADKRCGVRAVSVHTIPGTDHRAVFAELVLPRGPRSGSDP